MRAPEPEERYALHLRRRAFFWIGCFKCGLHRDSSQRIAPKRPCRERGALLQRRAQSTRRCTIPLFRSECTAAAAGSRWNPEAPQYFTQPARQTVLNTTLGLGHTLDEPWAFSPCCTRT